MKQSELQIGGYEVLWRAPAHILLDDVASGLRALEMEKFIPEGRTPLECLRAVLLDAYHPADKDEKYILRPFKNGLQGYSVVCEKPRDDLKPGDMQGQVKAIAGFDEDDELQVKPWDYDKRVHIRNLIREEARWLTAGSSPRLTTSRHFRDSLEVG